MRLTKKDQKDMEKYCTERFKVQRRLAEKIAPLMEINDILEKVREEKWTMLQIN